MSTACPTRIAGGGEALEEYLQQTLDPVIRNLALGENNEVTLMSDEQIQAALMGFLMSEAFNAPSNISNAVAIAQSRPSPTVDAAISPELAAELKTRTAAKEIARAEGVTMMPTAAQESVSAPAGMYTQPLARDVGEGNAAAYAVEYTPDEIVNIKKEGRTFRNLIAGIDETVSNFFNRWKDGRKTHLGEKLDKLYLGKSTDIANEDFSNILGYDVDGRDFIITNDDVKHIMDHHGDSQKELGKGNLPLTSDIFDALPEIVRNPDDVRAGDIDRQRVQKF